MNPVAELEDLYPRLFTVLPATSRGRTTENSAAYAARPDPRRAPVRVEVHDLISDIETDVPDLARWACSATGLVECLAAPVGSDAGRRGNLNPKVVAAFVTLRHHWFDLEDLAPTMASVVVERISRLVAQARRLIGETACPIPLASPCPSCDQPTIFRVETEQGVIAVCSNPLDRDDSGNRLRWTEIEWEDAHHERNRRTAAG